MDKNGILKVCVDDFAFKKRYSYGSILIDIETHRIIDLLDSREKEPVAKWLKKYPNLQLVSRDGSHIYSAAIHEAHPNAIQVSDRFHLLKNLSEAVEKYMLRLFPARLEIPATKFTQNPEMQALLDTRNRYERIMFVRKKKSEGLTASEIALLMHASLSTITKYLQMKEEDIPPIKSSLREREHKTSIGKKCKKILYVRNLSKQGKSIEEIVRITGHTRQTVRNYLSDGCSIINGHYDNKRPGKLAPYETEIIKLRSQGVTYAKITEIIREKGYCGTVDALRVFMQKEREHYKNAVVGQETEAKEYIARRWMVRLIYKGFKNVNGITLEQYDAVIKKYPILGEIYKMIQQFHSILFSKNANGLDKWMNKTKLLKITEINSFIEGMKKDITAVKNSILYSYNNGIAEGSVNKLKVVKRIMYGRNSFLLLKSKILRLELLRLIN